LYAPSHTAPYALPHTLPAGEPAGLLAGRPEDGGPAQPGCAGQLIQVQGQQHHCQGQQQVHQPLQPAPLDGGKHRAGRQLAGLCVVLGPLTGVAKPDTTFHLNITGPPPTHTSTPRAFGVGPLLIGAQTVWTAIDL